MRKAPKKRKFRAATPKVALSRNPVFAEKRKRLKRSVKKISRSTRRILLKKKIKYVLNLKKHKCFWSTLSCQKRSTKSKFSSQRALANVFFKAGLLWLGVGRGFSKASSRSNFFHKTLIHKDESYKTFLTKGSVSFPGPALKFAKYLKFYVYYKALNFGYVTTELFFNEKSTNLPFSVKSRPDLPHPHKQHHALCTGYLIRRKHAPRRKAGSKGVKFFQSWENYLFFQKRNRALLKRFWKRRLTLVGYFADFDHFGSNRLLRLGYPYPGDLRKGWNRKALGNLPLSHLFLTSQTVTTHLASLTSAWLLSGVAKKTLPGKESRNLSRYFQSGAYAKSFFGAKPPGARLLPLRLHYQISKSKPLGLTGGSSPNPQHFIKQTKNLSYISYLLSAPLIFKYFWSKNVRTWYSDLPLALRKKQRFGHSKFFTEVEKSNLAPLPLFQKVYRRRVLRLLRLKKFLPNTIIWSYLTLVRFIELLTGKYVYLKFNPFVQTSLTFLDLARCQMWEGRVIGFRKVLGPRIFLNESIQIIYLAIKYKDPTFLTNWIDEMLTRIKFWSYRQIFRYLKYVLKVLLRPYFSDLGFKGLKLKLKGKIAVAGNARTRTLFYRIGQTSHATMDNRVHQSFRTFETFTGVLGFRLWFFFYRKFYLEHAYTTYIRVLAQRDPTVL